MADLVLVRHAMPAMRRDVAAERWRLAGGGRAAAPRLAALLPGEPLVVTSAVPKARQTGAEIVAVRGGTVAADARLDEAARPTAWSGGYEAQARSYIAGRRLPGWDDAAAFWEALRFPDAWDVSLRGARAAASRRSASATSPRRS